MCVNKIYVRDYLGRNRFGGFYPCGHCHSCKQASANRRAVRIRSHNPKGYTCYFVTLDYSDRFVPYIRKSDILLSQHNQVEFTKEYIEKIRTVYLYNDTDNLNIPIYRDWDYYQNPRRRKLEKLKDPQIDEVETPFYHWPDIKDDLSTLCISAKCKHRTFDDDRIGICYMPDLQKFLKRLRVKISRSVCKDLSISYYATFEYGSTFSRPHLHLAIWAPNSYFTETSLRRLVFTSWSYSDRYQEKVCVIARSCAKYLASYVNCSSTVSQFLQNEFPPKHSHSLGIGFDQDGFDLSTILDNFKNDTFEYHYITTDKNGRTYAYDLPLPSYVLYRYFPRIKGFSRLSRRTLYRTLTHIDRVKIGKRPYFYKSSINDDWKYGALYDSNIITVHGTCLQFRDGEWQMFARRFYRTYWRYYAPLDINFYDFVSTVVDFYIKLDLHRYKMSLLGTAAAGSLYAYDNLLQVANVEVDAPTVSEFLPLLSTLDSNYFPENYNRTKLLEQQFEANIKQRNINLLPS
ncbi:MAG: replication initiator protein [Microviridae sp.]|nr:MAG: replication initiator protein [Microviridae sp.]